MSFPGFLIDPLVLNLLHDHAISFLKLLADDVVYSEFITHLHANNLSDHIALKFEAFDLSSVRISEMSATQI